MLLRPSFCCNCGEKIERANWKLWTSRRFCELCETDFTLQEIIPKLLVGLGLLVTVVGVGSYFRGEPDRSRSGIAKMRESPASPPQQTVISNPPANSAATPEANLSSIQGVPGNQLHGDRTLAAVSSKQEGNGKDDSDGPVYFCGAATKKGTPCTRRVKGNVRCYQHIGQPAMLSPKRLRAER